MSCHLVETFIFVMNQIWKCYLKLYNVSGTSFIKVYIKMTRSDNKIPFIRLTSLDTLSTNFSIVTTSLILLRYVKWLYYKCTLETRVVLRG